MSIPDEKACLALLRKLATPEHIIDHSLQVWRVGKLLGEGLIRSGQDVDLDLLRASCLLHDIAKYPCIVSGKGYHDRVGQEMLNQEGLPSVARIIVQHVVLRNDTGEAIKEEHLLNYSDKRVIHDRIVSLDERFQYLEETYGKFPQAKEALEALRNSTRRLEQRIFALLDFEPEDMSELIAREFGIQVH